MSWTNEMSDKAIYALMDRCGMLQNMTLRGELDQLVNAVSQAFRPAWGGPDDPDVLKRKIEELQQRLSATDQQNDDLIELLTQAMPSVDYHASMKGEDGEHLYQLLSRIQAAIPSHNLAVNKVVSQPFTEQFIEDHLGKMPASLTK